MRKMSAEGIMKLNVKNAISILYLINWITFFTCFLGSVFLFKGDTWLEHSISFLGTKEDTQWFFSFSLFVSSASGLLFVVMSLIELVVVRKPKGKRLRRVAVAGTLLVIAHIGLMTAAFFPTHTYKVIHWTGGSYYFGGYAIGMLILSYSGLMKDSSLIRVLLLFYVIGGLFGYFIFKSILYAEVFMITILFVWSYLLFQRVVPNPVELKLSNLFGKR